MRYFLGVDVGTSSTKAVIADENAKILAQAKSQNYKVEMPHPMWAQQSADVWMKGFLEAAKKVVEDSNVKKIEAVCISGLYGGSGVPLDDHFEPLGPALIWMDKRATEETEWIKENVDIDKLFKITGNYVDPYFGFTKILWLKRHHPDWKKFNLLLSPKDYVIFKLTGEIATDYSSAGNIGGIFNLKKRIWSNEMLDIFGLPSHLFPERILPSNAIVGKLGTEFASLIGLESGTPVVCGGIDAAVATYAAGVEKTGQHVAMIGTSMCWGTIHDGKYLTPKMVNMPYVIDPDHHVYSFGGATTAGAIIEWFKREMASDKTLEELEAEAKKVPFGSEGVTVEPYFMGERAPIWNANLRGAIKGLTLSHTRAHVYRAFLESIANSLKLNVEVARKSGIPLNDEIFIVGGATNSKLWLEIISQTLGMKVKTLDSSLDAPIGDVKLAIKREM